MHLLIFTLFCTLVSYCYGKIELETEWPSYKRHQFSPTFVLHNWRWVNSLLEIWFSVVTILRLIAPSIPSFTLNFEYLSIKNVQYYSENVGIFSAIILFSLVEIKPFYDIMCQLFMTVNTCLIVHMSSCLGDRSFAAAGLRLWNNCQ